MSSPAKGKDKKKEPPESKKRQLLNVFHQTIGFLQILSPDDIDALEDQLHVFVFSRGQTLAKEMEPIDYVGVIAEGRAVSKSKNYQIGDIVGHLQVLGLDQKHPESITGESDGVIIALRILDLTTLLKPALTNKITAHLAEAYVCSLLGKEQQLNLMKKFDPVEEKKITKYFTPEWSQFYGELDFRQKFKFNSYFPFYSVKQKDLILSNSSKGYLLYVIHGQVISKNKQQSAIIQSGHFYHTEGFLLDEAPNANVYCLSSDAQIIIVSRKLLEQHFKVNTFANFVKMAIGELQKKYRKDEEQKQFPKEEQKKQKDEWSIFKKYPEREIVPLPKKAVPNPQKNTPKTITSSKQEEPLLIYQTLFRDQLGSNDSKLRTNTSVSESNYGKLYSLKTEPQEKESSGELEIQKLRKEVQILNEKLKFTDEMNRNNKLDLIENRSRLAMGQVLKDVRKMYREEEVVHQKIKKAEGQVSESLVTFKEVFDKQVKENRIQELVAKCAFKWLYLTRKHKSQKKY